ncbi:aldehyde dehydrogenase family protein [Comamonas sp. JC664]|uniref:aldehyde dehydrogenase family protein n=1 Tax=Comamonas sp. JC664 TaxID=2801917 RepID=UPI003611844C
MAIPAWKIAPALAFGNTVVLSPRNTRPAWPMRSFAFSMSKACCRAWQPGQRRSGKHARRGC